jgi:hypothetical protein
MLVTLSGLQGRRLVVEVPTGALLTDVLAHSGVTDLSNVGAVLLGGYHGAWLPTAAVAGARLSRVGLAPLGASLEVS